MRKILAIITALITGGIGIAAVSMVPQSAEAGVALNWPAAGATTILLF